MEKIPDSLLLRQLEDLAGLSKKTGLIEIKPFRLWKGDSYWSNVKFKMRLCNAGEVLEVASYGDKYSSNAQEKAVKIEIVIRSIYEIDNQVLGSSEEVNKYNETHNTSLTRIEYLRIWANNLEQLVIDTLYNTYVSLQMKQVRLVFNQAMCENCGTVYERDKLPEGSREIMYSTGEIICSSCLSDIHEGEVDFKLKENKPREESSFNIVEEKEEEILEKSSSYICMCKKEFDTFEEFTTHRAECPEANK